ncbi:hypothetical protein L3Q65_01015 (plasmid) [Amycolatopsis sp. FU40]|uniref:hypothetical protein n=1 Tax=Amycolatopsis sp. FU40 TaxID=2914159 RepID=UPI001F1E5800|nr:hypothetical protein [Amycolatopsis sp. FU40]UKD50906.1 hypothetical protein L3Q65_01015 [Amycolatopsis sp. FU40]
MIAKTAAKTALLAALALAGLSGTVPASAAGLAAATGGPSVTITLGLPDSAAPAAPDPAQADPNPAKAAGAARTDTAARSSAVVWHSAISEASGLRIRKSYPNGRVLTTVPRYAAMWVSCKQNGWYRVAYHRSNGWIYGWSSASLIEINPDASIPKC